MNNGTPDLVARLAVGNSLVAGDIIRIKGKGLDNIGNVKVTKTKRTSRESKDGVQQDVEVSIAKSRPGQVLAESYVLALEVDITVVMNGDTVAQQQALQVCTYFVKSFPVIVVFNDSRFPCHSQGSSSEQQCS